MEKNEAKLTVTIQDYCNLLQTNRIAMAQSTDCLHYSWLGQRNGVIQNILKGFVPNDTEPQWLAGNLCIQSSEYYRIVVCHEDNSIEDAINPHLHIDELYAAIQNFQNAVPSTICKGDGNADIEEVLYVDTPYELIPEDVDEINANSIWCGEVYDIEKSQYRHKYIKKIINKDGKVRYYYVVDKIKGTTLPTIHNPNKEITKYHSQVYPQKKNLILEKQIRSMKGVEEVQWDKASTGSLYLKFKKDGRRFKIRLSSHTQSSNADQVLFPMYYNQNKKDKAWEFDINLGEYKFCDIRRIIRSISKRLDLYDNPTTVNSLQQFAAKHNFDVAKNKNDLFSLIRKYIHSKQLKEDKDGTLYHTLRYICVTRIWKKATELFISVSDINNTDIT